MGKRQPLKHTPFFFLRVDLPGRPVFLFGFVGDLVLFWVIMMITILSSWVFLFVAGATIHAYVADVGQVLIRRRSKIPLGLIEFGVMVFVFGLSVVEAVHRGDGLVIRDWAASLIVAPFVRWIVHDMTMNIVRDRHPEYLGKESTTDDILRWWKKTTNLPGYVLRLLSLGLSFHVAKYAYQLF